METTITLKIMARVELFGQALYYGSGGNGMVAGRLLALEDGSGGLGRYSWTGHGEGGQTIDWLCPVIGLS